MALPPLLTLLLSWSILLLASTTTTTVVEGYASWLKCYIEFDDKEEIVMHHPLRGPDASEYGDDVRLEVQSYTENFWTVADEYTLPAVLPPSASGGREEEENDSFQSLLLKVRLSVPPELKLEDVQFVVELQQQGFASNSGAVDANEAAAFVDLGVMCDGRRAFSRSYDEHVVLQINTTTTISSGGDADGSREDIWLAAAWAYEYGPVTLTRTMKIKRNRAERKEGDDEL